MAYQKIDVEIRIAEIFGVVLKRTVGVADEVVRDREAKWDSLANLELVMSIEDAFDLRFSPEQLELFKSKSWITQTVLEAYGSA